MPNNWPLAPLSRVILQRSEFDNIDDLETYKRVRVQLHAKGIVLRDISTGAEIKIKRQQRCRAGEFLVAEIDAKVGGFGIVPDDLDGAIVSSHYFLFELGDTEIDRRFLDYFVRTPTFQDQVHAQGSTNYAAIRPADVLSYQIPLPPLDEQRRIVARIEALAAKTEEARNLRHVANEEAVAIFDSALNDTWQDFQNWTITPVSQLARTVMGQVDPSIEPYASLPHINGEAMESGTCRLLPYRLAKDDGVKSGKYHFKKGAILYSKIRPYLRKAVHVPFEGVCSADVYAFDWVNPELEPLFFMYSLVAPQFTQYANLLSGRTRMPKLNQNQLFAFQMAYPTLPEQRRIVAYLDGLQAKVDTLKKLQAETAAKLDALLPSILDKAFKGEL